MLIRYLKIKATIPGGKRELKILAATSIFLAIKCDAEIDIPAKILSHMCGLEVQDILTTERIILQSMGFKIS